MRIKRVAFATSDGRAISRHFGHVRQFLVVELDESRESHRSLRQRADQPAPDRNPATGHDHEALLDLIGDCDTIVAGGMGKPMADRAAARGFSVILTSERDLEAALGRYQIGLLNHEQSLLHGPGRM
jgi:predicted Fe-Mo cluster-binding NifX family protein